ncbi:MAG: murein biosynthesis integral membrane protein MurJ [Planctomycetes bacterium]|nr:murein biosynthesis integral membrane protein MurJ [Planctomycetota bacterium]
MPNALVGDGKSASADAGWISRFRLVGLCTLLSRVLGLVRDIGMAVLFGNSAVMDAFSVAFRVPNLVRRLFGEGALTTAFLPAFVREREQSGADSAWKLASTVFLALACLLTGVVLLGELALWMLSRCGNFTPETELLISLTALMLPYLILICLAAQVSAVLHALGHFTWPALLPVVLNVVWIASLLLVVPELGNESAQMTAVAGCILLGGVLQLAAPIPTLYRFGFRFRPDWRAQRKQVKEIGRSMLPIVVGLSITQINTLADSLIAWGFTQPAGRSSLMPLPGNLEYPLQAGTASALYFGQRMYQFPLGVFGVALGTVLFPLLTRHAQAGNRQRLCETLSTGLRLVICIGVPASVGLILIAEPLTALLFQHGAFDAADVQQTSEIIRYYASAVWAYCGLLILHRAFYAVGDRLTPMRVGLIAVALNFVLNLTLIWILGGGGLALATAIAALVQLAGLILLIEKRIGRMDWRPLGTTLLKTAAATMVMAAVCAAALQLTAAPPDAEFKQRLWQVLLPLLLSLLAFAGTARLIRLKEFGLILKRETPPGEDSANDTSTEEHE